LLTLRVNKFINMLASKRLILVNVILFLWISGSKCGDDIVNDDIDVAANMNVDVYTPVGCSCVATFTKCFHPLAYI